MLWSREQTFVNFRHFAFDDPGGHAFRWLSVKCFTFDPRAGGDRSLLERLVAHVQFRDNYAGGGVTADGDLHGPFWLRLVTPDAYTPVDERTALRELRDWACQFGDVPPELEKALIREAYAPVRAATGRYRLSLGEPAWHDWGWVIGEFHEFVLINRHLGTLRLLVAADD